MSYLISTYKRVHALSLSCSAHIYLANKRLNEDTP